MKCCKTQVERLMGIHEWLQQNGYPNNASIEVMRWILAWGSHCTVKAPAGLRRMVREQVLAMHGQLA